MAKTIAIPEQCPMDVGLNILSGKWKLRILWHISRKPIRFNELQRSLGTITTKTLTQQLRELEEQKIVLRTVYPEMPLRVEFLDSIRRKYSADPKGVMRLGNKLSKSNFFCIMITNYKL